MFTAKIPLTLRASLQRNTGAFVFAIEDDSPAFFANILPGDVVIGVDGEEILTPSGLSTAASQKASATIVLQLLRGGEVVNVSVAPEQPR
jgi:S1-C subfamily serine protease